MKQSAKPSDSARHTKDEPHEISLLFTESVSQNVLILSDPSWRCAGEWLLKGAVFILPFMRHSTVC